jgi:ethanolamine ammonia-lyase small subunit
MKDVEDSLPVKPADLAQRLRERTPARLLVGRAGEAYTTATQLQLRADHATARDAVWRELDWGSDFGLDFAERWKLFEVRTRAASKTEYLLQPHLGRELDTIAAEEVAARCTAGADLQIMIGDGLSASAVVAQVPSLLPLLVAEAERRGWKVGQPFLIRHCRVGVMNHVGEILHPRVVVLLIGERPGMSTAESVSAYMAYQPRPGHSDAERNLISNIHGRGVSAGDAAVRIANLAAECMRLGCSGTAAKEPGEVRNQK